MSQPNTFDPTLHPALGVDTHLPVVPQERLRIEYIYQRFKDGAQGEPEVFGDYARLDANAHLDNAVKASVLVAIVDRAQPTVLFTVRSPQLKKHSGQISFAGGRLDESDPSDVHAALREAQEEIGLRASDVRVMGEMNKYLTGTGYLVTPVVAWVDPRMQLTLNPHEVTEIFEVPLRFLMNPSNHRRHSRDFEGKRREWFSMPYIEEGQERQERFIWGATAGILRNFYHFLMHE
jgi:8-oxo-dGTP pyrophosphatase MutT (NUDIX family)